MHIRRKIYSYIFLLPELHHFEELALQCHARKRPSPLVNGIDAFVAFFENAMAQVQEMPLVIHLPCITPCGLDKDRIVFEGDPVAAEMTQNMKIIITADILDFIKRIFALFCQSTPDRITSMSGLGKTFATYFCGINSIFSILLYLYF